jgi:hypothetical protein
VAFGNKKPRKATQMTKALTPKQEQAAMMLAAGFTVTDTATSIEVDRATVSQWQKNPAFAMLVDEERQVVMSAVRGKLISLGSKAVATLERLLDSTNERVALSAATGILQNSKPAIETEARKIDPFNILGS